MTIEEAIQAHLVAAVASKTALVFQGAREQGSAIPAVTWDWLPGGESLQDMSSGPLGVAMQTVQIDAIASTAKEAAAIRELIRLAFQNHSNANMGASGSPLSGGVKVWGCFFSGSSSGFEPETSNYVRSIDFEIHHKQALT